jgi:hypothetical protein
MDDIEHGATTLFLAAVDLAGRVERRTRPRNQTERSCTWTAGRTLS